MLYSSEEYIASIFRIEEFFPTGELFAVLDSPDGDYKNKVRDAMPPHIPDGSTMP
jgi:hypothetical protein